MASRVRGFPIRAFDLASQTLAFYQKLRDESEPGKPCWNTETADVACGGNPWGAAPSSTLSGTSIGSGLAKQDVRVVAHICWSPATTASWTLARSRRSATT